MTVAMLVARVIAGYQAREQTQDAETQIPGSGIGLHKLVVLNLAGVEKPDQ